MISNYLNKTTKTAPLAVFRIFFGLLMFISIVRFWAYGWIDSVYVQPNFFFSYYGFEFVKPLGEWTYLLFAVCGITALMICAGYKYRLAIVTFFLSFTYIELIDKTTYLNHYYFISILSFLLIFLPLNVTFSIDSFLNKKSRADYVPQWTIDAIKLLLAIVYIYAGLAKLNSDWLLEAQPIKIWLRTRTNFPLIGGLFQYNWMHYFFSWFGMLYDLFIVFFLLYKPTRKIAYVFLVLFHVLTHLLFPIGMFPYIMIVSGLIFFDVNVHQKILAMITKILGLKRALLTTATATNKTYIYSAISKKIILPILAVFFTIQLLLPWRYLAYPEELFWTEEGYRFSWRVMLIEKVGLSIFTVVDPDKGKRFEIRNSDFLTNFQIKQMSTQPDFIVQYAHMLRDHYITEGIKNPEIYVKSYVTLNGRLNKEFINSKINLANEKDSFVHKKWILPFYDTIKGL